MGRARISLAAVAISIVTNYAARYLDGLDNPWITWVALGILVVAFVTISLLQTKKRGY